MRGLWIRHVIRPNDNVNAIAAISVFCRSRQRCSIRRISPTCVALAFGLTVLTMAFAIGHVSGCHLNPAVSIGLCAGNRFTAQELVPYLAAQVLGGIVGAGVLYVIASGKEGFSTAAGFAANGYGAHSPGGYSDKSPGKLPDLTT